MNEQQFESKMEKDGDRVKKAFSTLVSDGTSQLKDEYDQFTGNVRDRATETASTVKKNIGNGMVRYNSKLQELADKFAGGVSKNVTKYPWVVISLGLILGLILGVMLKPSHKTN